MRYAVQSTLDMEYDKNLYYFSYLFGQFSRPWQGAAAAPKKTVKLSDSVLPASAGLDGLPREDISGKITPNLIKNLGSSDWKVNTLQPLWCNSWWPHVTRNLVYVGAPRVN